MSCEASARRAGQGPGNGRAIFRLGAAGDDLVSKRGDLLGVASAAISPAETDSVAPSGQRMSTVTEVVAGGPTWVIGFPAVVPGDPRSAVAGPTETTRSATGTAMRILHHITRPFLSAFLCGRQMRIA